MFDLQTIEKINAEAERAYFAQKAAFTEPHDACTWAHDHPEAVAPFTAFIVDGRTILVQPIDDSAIDWHWTEHVCRTPIHATLHGFTDPDGLVIPDTRR